MQTIHEELNEYPLASCRAIALSVALAILGIVLIAALVWVEQFACYGACI